MAQLETMQSHPAEVSWHQLLRRALEHPRSLQNMHDVELVLKTCMQAAHACLQERRYTDAAHHTRLGLDLLWQEPPTIYMSQLARLLLQALGRAVAGAGPQLVPLELKQLPPVWDKVVRNCLWILTCMLSCCHMAQAGRVQQEARMVRPALCMISMRTTTLPPRCASSAEASDLYAPNKDLHVSHVLYPAALR